MEYTVRHRTTYRYAQDVSSSHHLVHLAPRETATQQVSSFDLTVSPKSAQHTRRADYFHNPTEWLALKEAHSTMEIIAQSRVRVVNPPEHHAEASQAWEKVCARLEASDLSTCDIVEYAFDSPLTVFTVDLAAYAAQSFTQGRPILAAAMELMSRIHEDFRYDCTVTDTTTSVDRIFEMRAGVCQDFAHVGIAAMRSLGLPARYVSGYLLTEPPPGQERLVGADASHAWFSIWTPPFGWVDLDPTNNVIPGEGHITVGWGRDYGDVAPINGVVSGGGDHLVDVGVDVVPAI
jgi:transglutaminase-like putative cysteine protease